MINALQHVTAAALQVLLLDEITVDLDVLGRADLLAYLRAETEERGACIVYATHIFDGLESWATHLMYLANGGLKVSCGGWLGFGLTAEVVPGWPLVSGLLACLLW